MNKVKEQFSNKRQALTFFSVFLFVFILNSLVLYSHDDLKHAFNAAGAYPTESTVRLHGLVSILKSLKGHYLHDNGRLLAHFFVKFFMQYNKLFFNIFNSLVFLFLGWLLIRITEKLTNKTSNNKNLYAWLFLFLWFFMPRFGKTVLWIAGSCNYMWTAIFYLSFILYNLYERKTSFWSVSTSAVFGLLAGATNENSAPAVGLMLIIYCLLQRIYLKKVYLWQFVGIVMLFIGFYTVVISPGALAMDRSAIDLSLKVLFQHSLIVIRNNAQLVIPYTLIFFLLRLAIRHHRLNKKDWLTMGVFYTGHLSATAAMILPGEASPRTFFGSTMFLFIVLLYLYFQVEDLIKSSWLTKGLCGLMLIFSVTYLLVGSQLYKNHQETKLQLEIIEKEKGHKPIIELPMLTHSANPIINFYSPYYKTLNITEDITSLGNVWMAKYYNVPYIKGIQ